MPLLPLRRPHLPRLGLIALLVGLLIAAATGASAAGAAVAPPLRVDGTVLRDQSGARVGLTGIAVQMVPFYATSTGGRDSFLAQVTARNFAQRDAEFTALQSLGYNSIRVHISSAGVYGSELYETRSASVSRVRSIVASAKAHGLVTVLDADATGSDLSNWQQYKPMFADLVTALGNDPWVVWEPFNEPADYSPGAPRYLAGVEGIGAYLRSLGSSQPMIVPSNGYEQDVSPVLMSHVLADAATRGWRGAGLMFGVHPYLDHFVGAPGNQGDVFLGDTQAFAALNASLGANVGLYPLIVTEMGRYNNGITTTNATREAYTWVAGLGAKGLNGLLPWNWDWALNASATDPNAWTWDGLHLNPWGQQSHDEALSRIRYPEIGQAAGSGSAPAPTTTTPTTATPAPAPAPAPVRQKPGKATTTKLRMAAVSVRAGRTVRPATKRARTRKAGRTRKVKRRGRSAARVVRHRA